MKVKRENQKTIGSHVVSRRAHDWFQLRLARAMKGDSHLSETSGLSERHSCPLRLGVSAQASLAHVLKDLDTRGEGLLCLYLSYCLYKCKADRPQTYKR